MKPTFLIIFISFFISQTLYVMPLVQIELTFFLMNKLLPKIAHDSSSIKTGSKERASTHQTYIEKKQSRKTKTNFRLLIQYNMYRTLLPDHNGNKQDWTIKDSSLHSKNVSTKLNSIDDYNYVSRSRKSVHIQTKYQKFNELAGKKPKEWSCPDSAFKLPLALTYKDSEDTYKMPDLSQMDTFIEEFKIIVIDELDLEVSDLPYYVECMKTSIYVSAFFLDGHSILSNQVKAMSYLALVLYLYDNELDEVKPTAPGTTPLSYSDVLTFNKFITNILTENLFDFDLDLISINFPHKYAILKFLEKFNELANLSIDNYKEECDDLIKLINEHFQAQAWAVLESNSAEKIESTADTYIFRRERTSAYYPCYEYSRLAEKIKLPREFKNSVLRGQIDRLACVIGCLVNDLLSWDREIDGTPGINYFYVMLDNNNGLAPSEVRMKIVGRIERDTKEMIRLCNLVSKQCVGSGSEDKGILHYLRHIQKCVDQNLFLHLYCPRYSYGVEWNVE